MSDLSEYEKIRLENIHRNAEFLRSLGLGPGDNSVKPVIVKERKLKEPSRKSRDVPETVVDTSSRRSSRRLSNQIATDSLPDNYNDKMTYDDDDGEWVKKQKKVRVEDRRYAEQTAEDSKIAHILDYDNTPQTSEDLDDFEFAIYALLRKWRHKRCAELDLEPYKIFQNKTICIIIRMRRNNDSWARKQFKVDQSNPLELSQADIKDIATDLLECWGIGPIKIQYPDGFGFEILHEMEDPEIVEHFQVSRLLAGGSADDDIEDADQTGDSNSSSIDQELSTTKEETSTIKEETYTIKEETSSIKEEVSTIKEEISPKKEKSTIKQESEESKEPIVEDKPAIEKKNKRKVQDKKSGDRSLDMETEENEKKK
mmetsp:Transcript_27479/g.26288  ORF Transcript_27479/g.26288 Transcript_27479/m.26288 type:complete len:370 (+) Transcript_27479:66-1175(+)